MPGISHGWGWRSCPHSPRLNRLELFSSVEITYVPRIDSLAAQAAATAFALAGGVVLGPVVGRGPLEAPVADVVINVRPALLREWRLGLGLGIEPQRNDAHLRVTHTRRNFLGGQRRLRLSLEAGWVVMPGIWAPDRNGPAGTLEAELRQPLWTGAEAGLTVGADLGVEYAYSFGGPRAQALFSQIAWRERVRLALSYNFQLLEVFGATADVLNDPAQARGLYGYTNPFRIGWWQQDLALDLRDRPLDPHRGLWIGLGAEEGGAWAGGAFEYQKLLPEVRFYIDPVSRLVIAARAQFGQIFVQGDRASPITRRLYLGGAGSHRGFSYNRLAPQVPSSATDPTATRIPVGGDQMLLVSLEARVDVVAIGQQLLSLVAFVDGGDVAAAACQTSGGCLVSSGASRALRTIDVTQLHWAVGGGVRLKTSIGTLRIDVGVRLNRKNAVANADGTTGAPEPDPGSWGAFHLSIGEAF